MPLAERNEHNDARNRFVNQININRNDADFRLPDANFRRNATDHGKVFLMTGESANLARQPAATCLTFPYIENMLMTSRYRIFRFPLTLAIVSVMCFLEASFGDEPEKSKAPARSALCS